MRAGKRNPYVGVGLDKRQARREAKRDIRRRKACTMHHPAKETPMERLFESLKEALPDVEVEHRVDDESIYVNYDFATALVIEPSDYYDNRYWITRMQWDRTGGVSAEHEYPCASPHGFTPALVVIAVKRILADEEKQQRKMEALLANMPEED